jgi:hypothetical protein
VLQGTARRCIALVNGAATTPIVSFQYFVGVLEEVSRLTTSDGYWTHLQSRVVSIEKQ